MLAVDVVIQTRYTLVAIGSVPLIELEASQVLDAIRRVAAQSAVCR
jgi:hypothetical protein